MGHYCILHLYCIWSEIHRYLNTEILLATCEMNQTRSLHVNFTNTKKEPIIVQHLFLNGAKTLSG
jgi:hypothetical protein